ncbi:MAG TPA: hypothetical protein VNE18_07595, partial [Rhodanobacter sp.]|nr:hypothetical protein [Rhodanobacter sp.]
AIKDRGIDLGTCGRLESHRRIVEPACAKTSGYGMLVAPRQMQTSMRPRLPLKTICAPNPRWYDASRRETRAY